MAWENQSDCALGDAAEAEVGVPSRVIDGTKTTRRKWDDDGGEDFENVRVADWGAENNELEYGEEAAEKEEGWKVDWARGKGEGPCTHRCQAVKQC